MRPVVVVMVALVLAGCSSSDDPPTTSTTKPPAEETTTSEAAPSITVEDLRAAAYGTAACFDDPTCPIVVDVVEGGAGIQVETTLFRDADAKGPGLALCVVATQLTDETVQVLATDGGVVASGKAGRTPVCDAKV